MPLSRLVSVCLLSVGCFLSTAACCEALHACMQPGTWQPPLLAPILSTLLGFSTLLTSLPHHTAPGLQLHQPCYPCQHCWLAGWLQFGICQDCYMPKDPSKQGHRGIGFVTYSSPESGGCTHKYCTLDCCGTGLFLPGAPLRALAACLLLPAAPLRVLASACFC
jgi:hypothetical protein